MAKRVNNEIPDGVTLSTLHRKIKKLYKRIRRLEKRAS